MRTHHRPGSGGPAAATSKLVLVAFLAEAVLAGGNGVAVRFSNRELPPLWGAGLRFLLASALIVAVMAAMRLAVPRGRALLGAAIFGLLQFAGAFGLYYYALVDIHAGFAQVLLALVPLATLILAVFQHQERLTSAAVAGSLIGLAGVGLLSLESLQGSIPVLSLLAVLGSVLCFAQALLTVRRFPPVHPVALNAVGMVVGALALLAASALRGEAWFLPDLPQTWAALGYVAAVGSVIVFLLYVFVVQRWSASRAAYVMVLVPFVTIVLSAWLDQEPITGALMAGGSLVIVGVYIGALRPARISRARSGLVG